MHLVRPNEPVIGVVTKNEPCTTAKAAGFVRHVEIDVGGTPLAGRFRAGQSFGVVPPGVDDKGKPHQVRLYSIAAPTRGEDGKGAVVSTTVKRTIDEHWDDHRLFLGVASNFLCDCQVGDEVRVTGPNGKRFLLPAAPEEHEFLFLATGTGIAPFRGMLLDLIEAGNTSRVALVMGSPYETDLLYHGFFTRMAAEHEWFTYHTAISRHDTAPDAPKMYVQSRLERDRDAFLPMLSSGRCLVYICGIAGMELGILQALATMLPREPLEQYVQCDAEALDDIGNWTRRMLHREVRPTRNVFVEVY